MPSQHSKHQITIGCLALQGAVDLHRPHVEALGADFRPVKKAEEFDAVDAFILPGGESGVMLKLIDVFDLWDSLERNLKSKPVWGICAGSILMAERVTNPEQKSFAILPIDIQRNGYGRQIDSQNTEINGYEVSFIRAPVIQKTDHSVETIASFEGQPVWVKKGHAMATTFHGETNLDTPSPMHQAFMEMITLFYASKAA